jgi:putative PIN family toxin of toxin-antitoxin system
VVVTVDTNVLFEALYSKWGASYQILRLIRHGEIGMALSVPLFQEYRDVLSRSESKRQLGLDDTSVEVILQFLATVGRPTDISYSWRPNLKDEADNMVVELALASRSEYLITSNIRDFTEGADLKNDDLKIVTPRQFMEEWRRSHGK